MKLLMLLFCTFLLSSVCKAAQKDKLWYKVESAEKKKEEPVQEPYEFDSLEAKKEKKAWHPIGFWSLKPKLSLGGGFLADKTFIEKDSSGPWFFASEISFRNRAWHRIMAGGLLTQKSNFIVSASWQFMPSREWLRSFYGVGAALSLFADSEFRSIVKNDRYFVTGSYGWEMLLNERSGLRWELKAYLGMSYYGAHLLMSYIWHL